MIWLLIILLLALFVVLHLFPFRPEIEGALKARLGEGPYKGLFALLSLMSLLVPFALSGQVASPELWYLGDAARWLALPLTALAFVLIAYAYGAKGDSRLARHPMLAGVALWAVGHLLVQGDLASVLIFGTLAAYSVVAIHLSDRHHAQRDPEAFKALEAISSPVPFLGFVTGKGGATGVDWRPVIAGLVLWLVLLLAHSWLFGASALPLGLQ